MIIGAITDIELISEFKFQPLNHINPIDEKEQHALVRKLSDLLVIQDKKALTDQFPGWDKVEEAPKSNTKSSIQSSPVLDDNKVYIGSTRTALRKRWSCHNKQ